MRSFWTDPAVPPDPRRIHPALISFADEVCATVARLFAYVGTLALIAMLAIHGWDQLQAVGIDPPAVKAGWSEAGRSSPAYALSRPEPSEKSTAYVILRHPEGGRKDILRWVGTDQKPGDRPLAELEIYRPGAEFDPTRPAAADLAGRMGLGGASELEAAGVIESKFGPVALLRRTGAKDDVKDDVKDGPGTCLGFLTSIDDRALRISGFSCLGDGLPARRTAIGCTLNRLILLTAGNEPKLAELFARAELRRTSCAVDGLSAPSANWLSSADNPDLRGAL